MSKKDLEKLLSDAHYKENYVPKPGNVVLKIDGCIIGTLGNFVVYSGLPKTGKSTFINAALASSFSELREHFRHKLILDHLPNKHVGYFDTESSLDDFYNNMDRIKFIARTTKLPDTMNIFSTREHDADTNRLLIEYYLAKWKPAILIIDGLLDIINNFNDERESKLIIQWLKVITKQCNVLIIGVIHLGKKDNHTLGHFGSMIDRYAQSVMEVSRDFDEDIYIIKPKYLRSAKTWFKPIGIQWTGNDYREVILAPPPEIKKRR